MNLGYVFQQCDIVDVIQVSYLHFPMSNGKVHTFNFGSSRCSVVKNCH